MRRAEADIFIASDQKVADVIMLLSKATAIEVLTKLTGVIDGKHQ